MAMAVVVAMEVAVAEAVAVLTAAAGAPGPAVSLTAAIASICVEAIASAMAASREAPGVVSKRQLSHQLSHHVHCHVQMQIRRRHEPCLHPNAPTPALRIIDIGRLGWGCRGAALSEGAKAQAATFQAWLSCCWPGAPAAASSHTGQLP